MDPTYRLSSLDSPGAALYCSALLQACQGSVPRDSLAALRDTASLVLPLDQLPRVALGRAGEAQQGVAVRVYPRAGAGWLAEWLAGAAAAYCFTTGEGARCQNYT